MDLFEIDYIYENKPIKRTLDKSNLEILSASDLNDAAKKIVNEIK